MNYSEKKCKVLELSSEDRNQWVMESSIHKTINRYVNLGMDVNTEGMGGGRHREVDEGRTRRMSGMILKGNNSHKQV